MNALTSLRARHGGKYGQLLDIQQSILTAIDAPLANACDLATEYSDAADAMREHFPDSAKADEYDEISDAIVDWVEELRELEGPTT